MKLSKFKLVLKLDKLAKSSNKVPICLRITKDRKSFYRTISHVEPEYWDVRNECVKKQHPNVIELNLLINKKVAEIKKIVALMELEDPTVTIDDIRRRLDMLEDSTPISLDFFEYAQNDLEKIEERGGAHATYKKYKTVISKLKEFYKKDTLPAKSITVDFVKQFERFLLDVKKNNKGTTIVNLKALARLLNDIYKSSKYNLDPRKNPFLDKKNIKLKRDPAIRVYLEADEVKRIEKLRFRTKQRTYDAKDIFLVECYTGLRISDILNLRWKNYNGSELSIHIRKTDKDHVIKVNKVVKEIIDKRCRVLEVNNEVITPDRYIFNILTVDIDKISSQDALNAISGATALINKNLKTVAKKAGIEKNISTHTGRHTFACLMVAKNINPFILMELMGHSDIRVTQIYAKTSKVNKNRAIDALDNLDDLITA